MTIKEKLKIHAEIEAENKRKLKLWERFNVAEKNLGFRLNSVAELEMYEGNGYDDGILMYC